ncbi:ATP-binding protein [Nakamurella sp. GG22]
MVRARSLGLLTGTVMAGLVILTYLLIVPVGGAVLGRPGTPGLWLSVVATAVVAIAFEPVRKVVRSKLSRLLDVDDTSPYQVLADFSTSVTGRYPVEDLPMRMAAVLARGTGASRAEVWLSVNGALELAACWPPGTASPADGRRHSLPVRERGELLGTLTVTVDDDHELSPVEERLFAGLAAQSGLVLRVAGLRAELEQELRELDRRTEELRLARRNLVSRQDAERQRLERNIHDGAQQQVLALLVNLRLAQTLAPRAPERAAALLTAQAGAATATIDTLTMLSRGLYPRLLTESGPVAALRAAVADGPVPVRVASPDLPRYSAEIEAAVYFCCLEAVQNATKHSGARHIAIDIANGQGVLELTITDDGHGFDALRAPAGGLANIRDRVEAVQGELSVESGPVGTTITARVPVDEAAVTAGAR